MLIECDECKARVDAEVIASHEYEIFALWDVRTYLLKCPSCNAALIGQTEQSVRDGKLFWPDITRVFPNPRRLLGSEIPDIVKKSMDEAERCIQAGAFLAATAMCGRTLEAICRHFSTEDTYLGSGLKELRDKGVIDIRLFEWGQALRDQRNFAAHATDEDISSQDASDVLTFTYAIIDYVFLLTLKFDQFQKRKVARAKKRAERIGIDRVPNHSLQPRRL